MQCSQKELFSGPFIEDGIAIVEKRRAYTRAFDLLRSPEVLQVALGKHVKQAMERSYSVSRGIECYRDEFALFISCFLQKYSPLTWIRKNG